MTKAVEKYVQESGNIDLDSLHGENIPQLD